MKKLETISLPQTGFLRLTQVLQFIPVSKSTWLNGVKTGKYPSPVKISEAAVAWRAEDIRALIITLGG